MLLLKISRNLHIADETPETHIYLCACSHFYARVVTLDRIVHRTITKRHSLNPARLQYLTSYRPRLVSQGARTVLCLLSPIYVPRRECARERQLETTDFDNRVVSRPSRVRDALREGHFDVRRARARLCPNPSPGRDPSLSPNLNRWP